ncbi:MAG: hypothetical protein IPO92_16675 [Saprospiraceae bacterium]|nr:hypothetical protein [Saprospiraceae bacterium]
MKTILKYIPLRNTNIFFGIFSIMSTFLMAQDPSFISAKYPTMGIVGDLESFAKLTEGEKELLFKQPANIELTINYLGKIIDANVVTTDTIIRNKLSAACYKLYDFKPATYQGVPTDSKYYIELGYFQQDLNRYISPKEVASYKPNDLIFGIDFGFNSGLFAGNISKFMGPIVGFNLAFEVQKKQNIYGLSVGLYDGKDKEKFNIPITAFRSGTTSNAFMAYFAKEFVLTKNILRTKLAFNLLQTIPAKYQDKTIYSINGYGPYLEAEYGIRLTKPKLSTYRGSLVEKKQHLTFYAGFHANFSKYEDVRGAIFTLGIRYRMGLSSIQHVRLK